MPVSPVKFEEGYQKAYYEAYNQTRYETAGSGKQGI
jgi:hypothetical protein